MEYLLDRYVEAYTKANLEAAEDMFPPFYIEYSKGNLTQEYLEKGRDEAKEKYGDDFTITYKIEKTTKLTDEELDKLNEKMEKYYKAKEKASECYKEEINLTFKGSKKEDSNSVSTMGYCNYNGMWYIVGLY